MSDTHSAGLLHGIEVCSGCVLDHIGGLLGVKRKAAVETDLASGYSSVIGSLNSLETDEDYRKRLMAAVPRSPWQLCHLCEKPAPLLSEYTKRGDVAGHYEWERFYACRGCAASALKRCAEAERAYHERPMVPSSTYPPAPTAPNLLQQAVDRVRKEFPENVEIQWVTPPEIDPLDDESDGVTLRDLIAKDAAIRQDAPTNYLRLPLTAAQRAAVSAHWSAELRQRIAEAEAKRGPQVVLDCAEDL